MPPECTAETARGSGGSVLQQTGFTLDFDAERAGRNPVLKMAAKPVTNRPLATLARPAP